METGPQLQRGVDVSELPWQRLARASGIVDRVLLRYQELVEGGSLKFVIEVLDDHLSAEIRLHLSEADVLNDLSFQLSEAVHHIRAAMDSMAWELSHVGGAPRTPWKVFYPTAVTEQEWESAKTRLDGTDDVLLDRLRAHQPFTRAGSEFGWPTAVVAFVSNADKHRGLLTLGSGVKSIAAAAGGSQGHDDAIGVDVAYDVLTTFPLEDGAYVGRLDWVHQHLTEIITSTVEIEIHFGMRVSPPRHPEYSVSIEELQMAISYLGNEFDYLLTGTWPEGARPVAPPRR